MLFAESGSWRTPEGKSFDFTNTYRWSRDGDNIRLEHLRFGADRPVYLFDLIPNGEGGMVSHSPHVCSDDLYTANLELTDEIRLAWTVLGPKLNEHIDYRYRSEKPSSEQAAAGNPAAAPVPWWIPAPPLPAGCQRSNVLPKMHQRELLTVEHTFFIGRPGVHMLVLSPKFMMPDSWSERGWSERKEQVTVVRPDGSVLAATAQINVTHLNIRDPEVPLKARWPITVWLTDRSEDEVPVGSKILADSAVCAAIFGEEPCPPTIGQAEQAAP